MSMSARGLFTVKSTAHPPYIAAEGVTLGRMTIDKQFQGDLQASSLVEMLATGTEVKGSAGYVALEWVKGTLRGKTGSFVLQHSGTMTRGVATLAVSVVPDSGAGELKGIAGTMTIEIVDGKHAYQFDYSLHPDA